MILKKTVLVTFFLCLSVLQLGFLKPEAKVPDNLYLTPSSGTSDPLDKESQKIFHLIGQVEKSPYVFLRNGSEHAGKEAARHLRWKYSKAFNRVKTAEAFIEHIASRSMLTGQLYLVKLVDNRYPLRDLLYNELQKIEES